MASRAAGARRRRLDAFAPDLPGYGDSEPGPGSGPWEAHVEALARFVDELQPGPVALVTHDWGVMIGLRWACDHPGAASALVISDGGFFSDRRWHDLANMMRTPGDGERLIEGYTREGFAAAIGAVSSGIDEQALTEYWKAFADDARRLRHLELYRSGDFEKLVPYEGRLAALALPALVLWGGRDRFAGVPMAQRFHDELPGPASSSRTPGISSGMTSPSAAAPRSWTSWAGAWAERSRRSADVGRRFGRGQLVGEVDVDARRRVDVTGEQRIVGVAHPLPRGVPAARPVPARRRDRRARLFASLGSNSRS